MYLKSGEAKFPLVSKLAQRSPAKAVKESGFWRAPSVSFQRESLIFTLGVPGGLA